MSKIPEAVVVDTRDGYVWARGVGNEPYTVAQAIDYARQLNDERKPEHRTFKAFKLVPVGTRSAEEIQRDRKASWQQPAWLHERNNDPYGTPANHPFWSTSVGCLAERVGDYKIFAAGGFWYAYDFRHNGWLHFDNESACREHCSKPAIDPWS